MVGGARTVLTALIAVLAALALGCDHVEHYTSSTPVGALSVDEACTVRRPWMPDTPTDTKCTKTLRAADGRTIASAIDVATLDPSGREVAATAGRRMSLYDAHSGALLGSRGSPFEWTYPEWSPDGTAFVASGGGLDCGLYVADVPFRSDLIQVDAHYAGSEFDWSPSGRNLGFVVSTPSPGGRGKAELWVWERATGAKSKVAERTFISWAAFTSWPGWIGEEAHLCGDYFSDPDPDCSRATHPK
jgi:hypothetical protein